MVKKRTTPVEVEKTLPRNKGQIARSIAQNWTEQSINCYRTNCNCMECEIGAGNYSFVCQMPKVVKILLEEIGAPEEEGKSKKSA